MMRCTNPQFTLLKHLAFMVGFVIKNLVGSLVRFLYITVIHCVKCVMC